MPDPDSKPANSTQQSSAIVVPANSALQSSAIIVGALILLAFAILVGFMLSFAQDTNKVSGEIWTRMTFIYGSVEALAFTAAGFFFGKEVHRSQAVSAEKRADTEAANAGQAKSEAATAKAAKEAAEKNAQAEKDKGSALARDIAAAHAAFSSTPPSGVGAGIAPPLNDTDAADLVKDAAQRIRDLAIKAQALYPTP